MKRRRTHAESRRRGEGREDFSTRRREGAKKGSKKGFTPTGIAFGDPEDRRRRRDAEVLRCGADVSGCWMRYFSSCRASPGEGIRRQETGSGRTYIPLCVSAPLRAKNLFSPRKLCAYQTQKCRPGFLPTLSCSFRRREGRRGSRGDAEARRRKEEGKIFWRFAPKSSSRRRRKKSSLLRGSASPRAKIFTSPLAAAWIGLIRG